MTKFGNFDQEKNKSKKMKNIRMFCYSIYLSLKDVVRENDCLIIDEEYTGYDQSISDLPRHLFKKFINIELKPIQIQFRRIGKNSSAHSIAHQTYRGLREPEKQLHPQDYFKVLDKTEELRKKALQKRTKVGATGFAPAQWSRQKQ